MNQNQTFGEQQTPVWMEDGKINELKFLESIQKFSEFRTVDGMFYDGGEHYVDDASMKRIILDELSRGKSNGLYKQVRELLELMRFRWDVTSDHVTERYIHVANGTIDTFTEQFQEKKQFTTGRLRVNYLPQPEKPERFLHYLQDLLEQEDILTLQEFLGYCLIPTTKAQKMLVISGRGGEGKSVLGQIIGAIWGDSLLYSSIQKITTDRFARATLINRLVMVDDDMALDALPQTHTLKTLITLNGKTDVEKKGVQSFQAPLYARFIGFTNGTINALYDKSHGFYRRLILLKTKERPEDRVDYPYLAESIISSELDQIFMWCLEGLYRLFENNLCFTTSAKARKNLEELIRESDSVLEFLDSSGYFAYDQDGYITAADLLELYLRFCQDNGLPEPSKRTAYRKLKEHLLKKGVEQVYHVPQCKTRSIRGYRGIRLIVPVKWIA